MSWTKHGLVFFCLLLSWAAQAQHTQTIRGTILDQDSKMPLIGANIMVANSDPIMGTTTDLDGRFKTGKRSRWPARSSDKLYRL